MLDFARDNALARLTLDSGIGTRNDLGAGTGHDHTFQRHAGRRCRRAHSCRQPLMAKPSLTRFRARMVEGRKNGRRSVFRPGHFRLCLCRRRVQKSWRSRARAMLHLACQSAARMRGMPGPFAAPRPVPQPATRGRTRPVRCGSARSATRRRARTDRTARRIESGARGLYQLQPGKLGARCGAPDRGWLSPGRIARGRPVPLVNARRTGELFRPRSGLTRVRRGSA